MGHKVDILMWWPTGEAIPPGWHVATRQQRSHHHRWSILLEKDSVALETQYTIAKWSEKTFGTSLAPLVVAQRADEEMRELMHAAAVGTNAEILGEAADVLIVLFRLAEMCGGDLLAAVEEKMATNRRRRWKLRGDGCGRHE